MKTNALLLFALAASFAACSDDTNVAKNASNELGLSVSISGKTSLRSLKDAFVSTDAIGVFVTGTGYTTKLAQYTFNGTTWSSPSSDTSKIFLSPEEATVYGFYPASSVLSPSTLANDSTNGIKVTVTGTDSSFAATDQIDYMYATATNKVKYLNPATNLAFNHGLAKVSFIVNKDQSFLNPGALTQVKLAKTTGFLIGAGVMKLRSGAITGLTAANSITFTGTATANAYNATPSTTKTAYGLVAPITATSGITLSMTIDGKVYSATLPSASPANLFAAGNEYLYTITLKGTEMSITSVSVTPWDTKDAGSLDMR